MRLDRIAPQPDPVWGRLVLESGKRPGGRNGEFLSCNEIWRSPGDGGTDVGRRVNAVAGANRHRIFEEVAFIVGGGGGSGVLIYQGHRYPLRVSGIGIGSIGIAEAKMSGIAYNLHRPSDITRHLFGGGRGPRGSRRRTGGAAAKRAWRASQTARRATRLSSDARCRRDDHLDALTRGPNAGLALKMQAELRRRPADVGVV